MVDLEVDIEGSVNANGTVSDLLVRFGDLDITDQFRPEELGEFECRLIEAVEDDDNG